MTCNIFRLIQSLKVVSFSQVYGLLYVFARDALIAFLADVPSRGFKVLPCVPCVPARDSTYRFCSNRAFPQDQAFLCVLRDLCVKALITLRYWIPGLRPE